MSVGPAPCPPYSTAIFNPDGTLSISWYRFWSGLSGIIPGSTPVFPPSQFSQFGMSLNEIDQVVQGLLPPSIPPAADNSGAIQQFLSAQSPSAVDQEARDLANQAFARVPYPPPLPGIPIIICTQATFPDLTVTVPSIIIVTDYAHTIYWDGTNAAFIDGGNRFFAMFDIDPTADATRPGWHLLDGTANVPYLNADGTLSTYTVEDATIAFFLEVGLANSGPTAAVAPGFSGTSATGNAAFSPANTASGNAAITGNTGGDSGGQSVAAGVGATVPGEPHTHPSGSIADSGHVHSYTPTDTGHSHAKGTFAVDATGEPRKLVRRAFFRQ